VMLTCSCLRYIQHASSWFLQPQHCFIQEELRWCFLVSLSHLSSSSYWTHVGVQFYMWTLISQKKNFWHGRLHYRTCIWSVERLPTLVVCLSLPYWSSGKSLIITLRKGLYLPISAADFQAFLKW
jgi:hypothetical protein